MKNLRNLLNTILLLSISSNSVFAASMILNKNFYWQIQHPVTYTSVCEGFIASCNNIPVGNYISINHTTGTRGNKVATETNVNTISKPIPPILNIGKHNHYINKISCTPGKVCIAKCDSNDDTPIGGACAAYSLNTNSISPVILPFTTAMTNYGFQCTTSEIASMVVQSSCLSE